MSQIKVTIINFSELENIGQKLNTVFFLHLAKNVWLTMWSKQDCFIKHDVLMLFLFKATKIPFNTVLITVSEGVQAKYVPDKIGTVRFHLDHVFSTTSINRSVSLINGGSPEAPGICPSMVRPAIFVAKK